MACIYLWRCDAWIAFLLLCLGASALVSQEPEHEVLPDAPYTLPVPPEPLSSNSLPSEHLSLNSPALLLSPDGQIVMEGSDSADPRSGSLTGLDPAISPLEYPFGYNLRESNTSWLVAGGNQFGVFSLETFPTLKPGKESGLVLGTGFHWLAGPIRTDMPPRLYDFQIGYQRRKWISDSYGYDAVLRIGAFSDFYGSARKGVRFPGHAVGYYRWQDGIDLAMGLEYLDRDDISLLPVVGMILTPWEDVRLELVFPRPRLQVQITAKRALYVGGELGGGTWAIERTTQTNDVVTYRDIRLLLGITSSRGSSSDSDSGFQVGYVFGRDLSYRSGVGDYEPSDAVLLRFTHGY